MILITHILIALTSILFTALALFYPSKLRLRTASSFTALTIASGTVLVIVTHSPLLQACVTGLCYLAAMFTALGISYYRLRHIEL